MEPSIIVVFLFIYVLQVLSGSTAISSPNSLFSFDANLHLYLHVTSAFSSNFGTSYNVYKIFITGECIAGALHWKLFEDLAKEIGLSGLSLVNSLILHCGKEKLERVLGKSV